MLNPKIVRPLLVWLHRWLGLVTAAFLFITGFTGAVISWDHELDDLLNPHLTNGRAGEGPISSLELARQVESRYPQVRVTFLPLSVEPGESLAIGVDARVDESTGRLFEPGFNQIFVDPASGEELGRREWGAVWPITRENFVSFLYKLHFSLHLPEMGGIDNWGVWLLGVIAILWTADCFVAAWLTLPARRRTATDTLPGEEQGMAVPSFWQRWKPAWKVRWKAGSYKLNYDLHRAFGLWTWGLLFIIAFTAFSLNLYREVFFPLMSAVSQVTPSPFDERQPTLTHQSITPKLGYAEILARARSEAGRRGWAEPAGAMFYASNFGIYGVQFFAAGADHGAGGVGPRALYLDGQDGRLLGERQPWQGTAADIFVQAQYPLHSGRILGLPGRILISAMGLVVAMLSVTGVYIWWKKWCGRRQLAARGPAADRRIGSAGRP